MSVDQSPGAGHPGRVTPAAAVLPTWRDLPPEPPYGPVTGPRAGAVGAGFAPMQVEGDSAVTPAQIALAVGGTLLLIMVGIGAAWLLLGADDEVADVGGSGQGSPVPPQVDSDPVPVDPLVPDGPFVPDDGPGGELTPQDPPGGPPADEPGGGGPSPDTGLPPEFDGLDPEDLAPPGGGGGDQPGGSGEPRGDGAQPQPDQPQPDQSQPFQAPPPLEDEDEELDLPRLFRLRTLPSGTAEESTTVRQTTRGAERLTEQVTELTSDGGGIGVRATRVEDAEARLEAMLDEDHQELSVRGQPAWLVDGQRLVWVAGGSRATLLEIDAPPTAGTEALLTIANGLELVR